MLVPLVAIPVSLIGAVFLMQALGFTVNLLTLLAIVLAVGLVVDDAIVVVENVERHMRDGKKPFEAALLGARELVGPILSMTITLAAVYAPIGLQGGLTGALFREFAFTLAGAVFISGVVALTLSPMMSSRLLKPSHGWFARQIQRGFDAVKGVYDRLLGYTLRARGAVYLVWIALTLAVLPMYLFSPAELAPNEDQGVVFGAIDVPANATLEQLTPYTEEVQRRYQSIPEFDHSFQLTFPTGGFGGILVKPWEDRKRNIFAIQADVGSKLSSITGIRAPAFLPSALPSAGTFPVEFVIASTASHEELMRYAQLLVLEAMKSGQFAFPPITDVRIDQAKSEIVLDRDKVASMGLTMQQVGTDLGSMLGGDFVNRFNIDGRSYTVIPQIERRGRLTTDQLKDIHIAGPNGQLIPVSAVATIRDGVEPRTLNRFQQLNSVKISGVAPRSLPGGLKILEDAAAKVLPPGYHVDYTGESRQLHEESGKFLPAMGLAVVLIFLVLAAQFQLVSRSVRHPRGLGAARDVRCDDFHVSQVQRATGDALPHDRRLDDDAQYLFGGRARHAGRTGVEKRNLDRRVREPRPEGARDDEGRGRPGCSDDAPSADLDDHGSHRRRSFPLTLVTGAGAVACSIGIVLVGGMSIGTLFTLFVVPSVYVLIAKDHRAEREQEAASGSTMSESGTEAVGAGG